MNPLFGISALPPDVAAAIVSTYGHHRTPWFERVLGNLSDRLRAALGERFTPLYLTCSGLGGREAAVANLVRPGDRVLTTTGDFERLARTWGADIELVLPGADPLQTDAVLLEHVSPSGALLDINTLATRVRTLSPDAPIVVDASVSFGADIADVRASPVDALMIVPERALMGIPGMTILAVTDGFVDMVARRRGALAEQPFLFDLLKYHRAGAKRTTPFSPNISACVALEAALIRIDAGGGLERHVALHAVRALAFRNCLARYGIRPVAPAAPVTNALTCCELPEHIDIDEALTLLKGAGIGARRLDTSSCRLQIAHAGYLPGNAIARLSEALTALARHPKSSPPEINVTHESERPPLEPPFAIAAHEFREQALRQTRGSTFDPEVSAKVADSVRRVFQDRHVVDEEALQHRTIGFVGAGRIVQCAEALCRMRGIRNMVVYSPSLARASSGKGGGVDAAERLRKWRDRGVDVAATLDELFGKAHVVVLLPVFYNAVAVRVLKKTPDYLNEGFLSASLLDRAERAGHLDLIINAAARGALVDRTAVIGAVRDGWLRYYSDEMASAGDALLDCEQARFTGHVGGSCRQPQAEVAGNTHKILRRVIAQLVNPQAAVDERDDGYRPNIVNAHLVGEAADARRTVAARDATRSGRIRILLTDPFDVESLGFDRLRGLDVHDTSHTQMSADDLVQTLRQIRPHIVLLRSRTHVDARVATAIAQIDELAFVIRPGVGLDNLYEGIECLSAAGVQIINEPYGNSSAVAEMVLHFILSGTETTLLAPGPTNFKRDVFDVLSRYDPVTVAVTETTASVNRTIGRWLGARTDAVTISGSGTAWMEASIANLTLPASRGQVISHGKFGDRFVEIAQARGRLCEVLRVPEDRWGEAIGSDDLERLLRSDAERLAGAEDKRRIAFLCFQQNETSSGVAYHQDAIRDLVRVARAYNPEMIIISDAISGALAHPLDFEALDVDALFFGSQKALGVSSGLAFGVLSERAVRVMLARVGYRGSLDAFCQDPKCEGLLDSFDRLQHVHSTSLLRALAAHQRGSVVDTPSLFHLLSTERALELLEREGGKEVVAARHALLSAMVRDEAQRLGLELMVTAPFESDSVTIVILPPGITASAVRKSIARETAIAVAGAQGDYWKARMIRIGTMGFVSRGDIRRCLRALRFVLTTIRPESAEPAAATLP